MKTAIIKKTVLLLAALPLLFLAGCNKEEPGEYPDSRTDTGEITFDIGFAPTTRATTDAAFNTTWENGDAIGLFAVRHAAAGTGTLAPSGNYIHNAKLTYNKNTNTWTADAGVPCFPTGTDVLDFYAYYPYNATVADPTNIPFNVKTDQSALTAGKSNYNISDLMTAAPKKNIARGTTVTLTFHHTLALVEVKVLAGTMKGSGPDATLAVSLRSVKPAAKLNLGATAGSEVNLAATNNTATNIRMCRVEQPTDANYDTQYTYRALVPAQTVAAQDARLFFFEQGNKLFKSSLLTAALHMTAGKAERYEQTLPFTIQTVKINKGTFQMGSPATEPDRESNERQHSVTLTKDFYMSKYPITNAQYAAFLNANAIGSNGTWATGPDPAEVLISASSGSYDWGLHWSANKWEPVSGKDNFPIICVTWYGAKAYAYWVGGFLPTEAQWEYACRAGTATAYSYGNNPDSQYMNYWDSGHGNQTLEVGSLKPNAFGLYDMHGNVHEWCLDRTEVPIPDYAASAVTDPLGTWGNHRMLRGGSWFHYAQSCRSASRRSYSPVNALDFFGFRVVFSL